MEHMITTPDQITEVLTAGRRRAGLTQVEAAERIGVSQSRISVFENDASSVTVTQLLALFGAYGIQMTIKVRAEGIAPPGKSSKVEW